MVLKIITILHLLLYLPFFCLDKAFGLSLLYSQICSLRGRLGKGRERGEISREREALEKIKSRKSEVKNGPCSCANK